MIYKAITEAYRHSLPSGKFPITLLFITIPPFAVDVNIHPTKAEVKFRDSERIFRAVVATLSSAHEGRGLSTGRIEAGARVASEGEGGEDRHLPDVSFPKVSCTPYLPFMPGKDETLTLVKGEESDWGIEGKPLFVS
jgi:hypothetical protein